MKIVVTDASTVTAGDLSFEFLDFYGDVRKYDLTAENEVAARIRDADVVLCNKTPMTKATLSGAEKLKYIGLFATGYNNIDLEYCKKHGITVCNAPAYSTDAVAQLVFAYLLMFTNRVSDYVRLVSDGGWIKSPTFSFFPLPLTELAGKTIGIVGFGSIGRQVASIAHAFKMNVLVYTRTPKKDPYASFVPLEKLLSESDYVTLHCPLNAGTKWLINAETVSKMKKGAVLINTSRGAVVDENALAGALKSGRLAGAAVDVLESEPMSPKCPLYGIENCLITPHIAWAGFETRERLFKIVENNLKSFLAGTPVNDVTD